MIRLFQLIGEWVHQTSHKRSNAIEEWIRIEYPEESKLLTAKQILEKAKKP